MEFYLQFGWGMMGHSRALLEVWDGGSVILSPRDLEPTQIERFADDVLDLGGSVLLDPQFYLPDADHERLRSHAYWPAAYVSGDFWGAGGSYTDMLEQLAELNGDIGAEIILLPGIHTDVASETWLERQRLLQERMHRIAGADAALYATVALSDSFLRSEDEVLNLLRGSDAWNVEGIYLLAEHPQDQYLVSEPLWLANLLDVTAGFRLRGFHVLLGYCNQQLLIAACASPTALYSGTWQNVRSFPPDKFLEETQIRRRSTWYYAPQALSEYQITYLDVAHQQGILEEMVAPGELGGRYADVLFSGPQPTAVDFGDPAAFRHFLLSFREQVVRSRRGSFEDTFGETRATLDRAAELVQRWRRSGVFGLGREFSPEVHAASTSALTVFETNRGPVLRRRWSELA